MESDPRKHSISVRLNGGRRVSRVPIDPASACACAGDQGLHSAPATGLILVKRAVLAAGGPTDAGPPVL
jgi:hypothetical protein